MSKQNLLEAVRILASSYNYRRHEVQKARDLVTDYILNTNRIESTGNSYQEQAMRTCSIPYEQSEAMLIHALTGLTSEAGEAAGIWQKTYQGHGNPLIDEEAKKHMMKELGDALWMIAEACTALKVEMNDVMKMNIDKLKARYPEGFESEKSLHRAAGDI